MAKQATKKKATKKAPVETTEPEAPKTRGRKADPERNAALTEELLKLVTIENPEAGPLARVTGLGEAAQSVGINAGSAKMLLLQHLGAQAGTRKPTPKAVYEARMVEGLSWGVIAGAFGIPQSRAYALADEHVGEKGAWRRMHPESLNRVRGGGGGRKASSNGVEREPRFDDETSDEEILAALDGKTIQHRLSKKLGGGVQKVKVKKGSLKMKRNSKTGARGVEFTEASTGNSRTIAVASIVK